MRWKPTEDALGECGGDCEADADADGICDDDVDDCVGERTTRGVCNGPGPISNADARNHPRRRLRLQWKPTRRHWRLWRSLLGRPNGNGICDDEEMEGCTEESAINFDAGANVDDGSCVFESDLPWAWNFTPSPAVGHLLGNHHRGWTIAPLLSHASWEPFLRMGIQWATLHPSQVDGLRYFSLTVYGDDLSTNEIDGMSAWEAFELRFYLTDSRIPC